MRVLRALQLSALLASLALPACDSEPVTALGDGRCQRIELEASPTRIAAVVIVNDSMRRDRAGAYGGPAATPTFDEFAASNLLFLQAVAQAPWTKPATATLFTSLYPTQHGVADHPMRREEAAAQTNLKSSVPAPNYEPIVESDILGMQFRTMAEVMRLVGVRTAAFVSNPWLVRGFGFDQGFQVYDDSFARWDASGEAVSQAGLAWLAGLDPDDSFLLYLHYVDSHLPYGALDEATILEAATRIEADDRPVTPEAMRYMNEMKLADGRPLLEADIEPSLALVEMGYERGVEAFDHALGVFLRGFAEHPAYDHSAILITSDHGEALFERGYGNHGRSLFEPEIAIPMAARLPGTRAADSRIDCPVGLIDVLPTLCDYFGIPCSDAPAGRSFLAPRDPDLAPERRYVVAEGLPDHPNHRSIQNARYKLLFEPDGRLVPRTQATPPVGEHWPYSLYDLDADPNESHDLLDPSSHHAENVLAVMSTTLRQATPNSSPHDPTTAPLDPATVERLKALGYLGSDPD